MNDATPLSYAKSIAYLRDASTIRAHVLTQFGRAPKLGEIQRIVSARNPQPKANADHFACGHSRHDQKEMIRDGKERCRRCYNNSRLKAGAA